MNTCIRIMRKDPNGIDHQTCPNPVRVDVAGQINNVPYFLPLCDEHTAEFERVHAEARARRKAHNAKVVAQHGPRRPDRTHRRSA